MLLYFLSVYIAIGIIIGIAICLGFLFYWEGIRVECPRLGIKEAVCMIIAGFIAWPVLLCFLWSGD